MPALVVTRQFVFTALVLLTWLAADSSVVAADSFVSPQPRLALTRAHAYATHARQLRQAWLSSVLDGPSESTSNGPGRTAVGAGSAVGGIAQRLADATTSGFGDGYQQLFGGSGAIPDGMQLGGAELGDGSGIGAGVRPPRATTTGAARAGSGGGQGRQQAAQGAGADAGVPSRLNSVGSGTATDNPYIASWQTQQGQRLAQQAASEQQQAALLRAEGGGSVQQTQLAGRVGEIGRMRRTAMQGLAAYNPVVTPEMAVALGGSDDGEDLLPAPGASDAPQGGVTGMAVNFRQQPQTPASGGDSSSAVSVPRLGPRPTGARRGGRGGRSGPAQAYLTEYDYDLPPLRRDGAAIQQGISATQRDQRALQLMQFINDAGPFGQGMLHDVAVDSPDTPNVLDMVQRLNDRVASDKARGVRGLSPQASQELRNLLYAGYGSAADTIPGDDGNTAGPGGQQQSGGGGRFAGGGASPTNFRAGGVVGEEAGRGFGYGDYNSYDYEGADVATGVPGFMQPPRPAAAANKQGKTRLGPLGGLGPGGGGGIGPPGGRNTSVGEIAPFCQPPLLLCTDRDIFNILGTEIDQVRFPDNVLEYNSLRLRRERVYDNLIDSNFSPWGGPTLDVTEVLSANFRLRGTLRAFVGLNGVGTNRLTLQTTGWDASRPDRWLPDSFAFSSGGLAIDNAFNRVDYVPTYIITGTGPGFATTSINFGPFVDFQVADFRS